MEKLNSWFVISFQVSVGNVIRVSKKVHKNFCICIFTIYIFYNFLFSFIIFIYFSHLFICYQTSANLHQNLFICFWNVVFTRGPKDKRWSDQLWGSGGQSSRSHKAKVRFVSLSEALFLTHFGWIGFLVLIDNLTCCPFIIIWNLVLKILYRCKVILFIFKCANF